MSWPHATDYNAAVQNPQLCFSEDDLRQGQAVGDLFGLPRPHSGNFADVYQIQGADGQSWAIKCFTRPVAGLRPRYQAISEHLRQTQRAFMVEFHYLDEGIRIHGQWYPLVKMRWVEGFRLNEFVREQLNKPVVLERLAQLWIRLGQELRDAGMAHGDLQHGNVLLVPGSKSSSLALKLIDYDGMFVPALADIPSGEVGHPNYQHPQRLREGGYDREMDRFAHLLIYTSLRCLRVGGEDLWQRYDSGENLLFREEDFRQPSKSGLLRELWDMKDREIRFLVGHLLLASRGPLLVTPSLDELVDESGVRPLSDSEETQIKALFGGEAPAPRRSRLAPATAEMIPVSSAVLVAEATVQTASLEETQPIKLKPEPPPLPPGGIPSRRRSAVEIHLDARPPADEEEKSQEAAPVVDPLLSILSRPAWLGTLGAIVLLSFIALNLLVWSTVKPPATTPPTERPPVLSRLEDVTIREGYKTTLVFRVDRRDCREPLTLRVEGISDDEKLPEDRHPSIFHLAENETSCTLLLLAPLGVGPPRRTVHVSLWQGDDKREEQTFQLSVVPIPRPQLKPLENISCPAGGTKTFAFSIQRNACRESLYVSLEGLPPQVKQERIITGADDAASLKLTVADDMAPQPIPLKLQLHVGDVIADSKALLLHVEQKSARLVREERPPMRLSEKMADALSVEAGNKGELRVLVDRRQNRSEATVTLSELPNGTTAAPLMIPSELSFANLVVDVSKQTEPGDYTVKLRLHTGDQTFEERDITLHVTRPRGLQESVRIRTIDRIELAGTLYHGWRGKKGMTVLMLHDLGQSRDSRGWKHLAETLQNEGHTVLAFDFRGHGDSQNVPRTFWDYSVNAKMLPSYVREKPLDDPPGKLEWGRFPPDYLPWLIHDIAAARMYLDLQHDQSDSPVNTFNLVVFGAGFGSTLGSLWLASEGLRFNGVDQPNGRIVLKPPEKLSVLLTVWLGMESRWKLRAYPVQDWIRWSHRDPAVPVVFAFGEDDRDTSRLLEKSIHDGYGIAETVPKASESRQRLLNEDQNALRWLDGYLVENLKKLPPQNWVPRKIKTLHSYWVIPVRIARGIKPQPRFFVAKRPGEEILVPLPLEHFDVFIKGLSKVDGFIPQMTEP
jgi:hypothetical protein